MTNTLPAKAVFWLAVAALARLLLQVLAMPPYAGLDEAYHVARVAFVASTGAQPSAGEPSIPRYLAASMAAAGDGPPAFGVVAERWPELVAARPEGFRDVAIDRARPDPVSPNYQAQQASLYYAFAGPVASGLAGTQLRELLVLRLLAVLCGAITVVATGLIGAHLFGPTGLLAGALLLVTPTWLTLVARAGNDAPACAALALGVLLALRAEESAVSRLAEALAWGAAIAFKLTTWPAVILLPLLWPSSTSRPRRLLTGSAILVAAALTGLDLATRTGNALGDQALWSSSQRGQAQLELLPWLSQQPWLRFLKIFVAQVVWTSGQHANALRPAAMALYLLPVLGLLALALRRRRPPVQSVRVVLLALAAFGAAQAVHLGGFLREAYRAGLSEPRAGCEGWYFLTFAPFWFGIGAALVLSGLSRKTVAFLLLWTLLWDVGIHEGALFCDYAGLSSPGHPGLLFRWGGGDPWEALERLRVFGGGLPGPWAAVALRALQVVALGILFWRSRDQEQNSAMSVDTRLATAEELLRMPRGSFRYELVRGELHRMSPAGHRHGRIAARLTARLAPFVEDHELGEVYAAETGFLLTRDPDTVRAPDVAFVTHSRVESTGSETEGFFPGAPDLAVEVMSPSDAPTAVAEKALEWVRAGTRVVVVLDPRNKSAVVYRPAIEPGGEPRSEVLAPGATLEITDVVPGWSVPLANLFT